ncbi:MAG: hypothetical protein WD153_02085 [Candidatus Paceibacterota bacterium]
MRVRFSLGTQEIKIVSQFREAVFISMDILVRIEKRSSLRILGAIESELGEEVLSEPASLET